MRLRTDAVLYHGGPLNRNRRAVDPQASPVEYPDFIFVPGYDVGHYERRVFNIVADYAQQVHYEWVD